MGVATSVLAGESAAAVAVHPDALSYRETLEDIRDELENPTASFPIAERAKEVLASALTGLAKKEVVAGIVTVVLLLLIVGALTDSHAFGESQNTASATTTAEPVQLAAESTPLSSVGSSANVVAALATNAAGNSPKAAAAQRTRVVEERPAATRKEPEKKLEPRIVIPAALSTAVMSRVDSMASKTGATAAMGDIQLATPTIAGSRRTTFDDGEPATAPQRARLIGDLPMPSVPDQVADVEAGEGPFNVDVDGRPVMSPSRSSTRPTRFSATQFAR
jgi:hypothetical protein